MADVSVPQRGTDQKYCQECAAVISVRAEICPKCGVRQAGRASGRSEKSKVAAGLFALFLGGIGIHKFYLGRPVQGIFYILFCWTLIPSLIALIEGIIYLVMSDDAFARQHGGG